MATHVRWDPPYRLPSSGMGPREGWPSNQPEQSYPPVLVPPTLAVPHPPTWLPFLWPLRSCHLGYATPVEVGNRGPHLQGLTPPLPRAPLFLLKGTDCNLGAGTCFPPASGSPKARCSPSHRPRTGARAGETVLPEARAPSPPLPCRICNPSVKSCK